MDFLDWFTDGIDYVGDLFKDAGDGASEALTKLFGGDVPDVPESEVPQNLEPLPKTDVPDLPSGEGMTVDSLIKQLSSMPPDMKKQLESALNNRMLMQGLSTGFGAALKSRAQDKIIESQKQQQDDQQDFLTEERKRRGAAPSSVAQVRPRGLTEGYLKG